MRNLLDDANEAHANEIKLRAVFHFFAGLFGLLFRTEELGKMDEFSIPVFVNYPSTTRFLSHADIYSMNMGRFLSTDRCA